MDVDELISLHPNLFHMAHADSWASIQQHGLLSTSGLLDMFEVNGPERRSVEDERRPESVTLTHPTHGSAVVRDNKPMTDNKLAGCLTGGLSPTDWYRLLNGRVFFWTTRERVETLLGARAYRSDEHLVLTVDTASLIAAHAASIQLSPINSGATVYTPVERGPGTFSGIAEFPFEQWRTKRSRSKAVVELTVQYAVPDIADHIRFAHIHRPGEKPEQVQ